MTVNFSLTIDSMPIIVLALLNITKVLIIHLLCKSPKLSNEKVKYICKMMSKK
mgnify:CR=1 FL=1